MVIDLDTLSRRCADGSAKVGDLLREAKILAARGNFDELAKWVDDELSGYASGRNLSRYRKVSGIPKYSLDGRNWGSLVVEDRRLRDILSTHWLHQPIDEIERYSSLDGSALLPFPPEAIDGSAKLGIKLPSDTAVEITRYEFARVVTDVRNELLRRLLAENPSTSSPPSPSNPIDWDVFICHASEDKDAFVRPLAEALRARGLKVWFDEFTLTIGDSLRREIDRGLAKSRFGIVIISPDFLKKEWPQRELDGLVAREIDGAKVILPVWHNVTREEILRYSPPLADRLAASSVHGLDKVTSDLMHAIMRPDAAPASTAVTPMPPTPVPVDDLWVSMDYPEKLGITAQLRTDGYELKWERQIDEAISIDIDGWEHVIVDRRDGTRARLKIKDAPIIGGYVVLLKRKKRTGTT